MATTTVEASELGEEFQEFLRRMKEGEEILIEEDGVVVARIVRVEPLHGRRLKDWHGDELPLLVGEEPPADRA